MEYLRQKAKLFRRRQIIGIAMILSGVILILLSGSLASLVVPAPAVDEGLDYFEFQYEHTLTYLRRIMCSLAFAFVGLVITVPSIIITIYYSWKRSKVVEELERLKVGLAHIPVAPVTRVCTNCGRAVSTEVKFCPYCGKKLSE